MTTAAPPVFLTVTETAKVLRVSKMTVYRLLDADELAHVRIGRSFRIRRESLARFIAGGGSSDVPYRTAANVARA